MKITAGVYKGLNIRTTNSSTRPTLSKIRQAVFNLIGNDLEGMIFIDVFTGSGIMGFEALSRGAALTVFNDIDPKILFAVNDNLKHLKVTEGFRIQKKECIKLLKDHNEDNTVFYFDPPFGFTKMQELIYEFEKKDHGIGIFEISAKKHYNFKYIKKERIYGNIRIIVEELI